MCNLIIKRSRQGLRMLNACLCFILHLVSHAIVLAFVCVHHYSFSYLTLFYENAFTLVSPDFHIVCSLQSVNLFMLLMIT